MNVSKYFDGLFDKGPEDKSTISKEYVEISPDEAVQLNTTNFRLIHRNVDAWIVPSEAFLRCTVRVVDSAGANIASKDVAFQNTSNLFSRAELLIDNERVDTVDHPFLRQQIVGLLERSDDFKRTAGSNMMWYPDTNTGDSKKDEFDSDTTKGLVSRNADYNKGYAVRNAMTLDSTGGSMSVDLCIPLKFLLPICTDWQTPIKGSRVELALTKNMESAIVHNSSNNSTNVVKTKIEKISLWMPEIRPSIGTQLMLEQEFNKGTPLPIEWSRADVHKIPFATGGSQVHRVKTLNNKPERVFIVFQEQSKQTNQHENSMIFDNLAVSDIEIRLNNKSYPERPYKPDFTNDEYTRTYAGMLSYNDALLEPQYGAGISYIDYKNLYPVFHFDLSYQEEGLFSNGSTVDLEVRFTCTSANAYNMFCIVESEASVELHPISSDRIRVVK